MRPLSFRVWRTGDTVEGEIGETGELVDVVDFEIGYWDGTPSTVALGKTIRSDDGWGHVNYGAVVGPDASYVEIREAARELIQRLLAPSEAAEGTEPATGNAGDP